MSILREQNSSLCFRDVAPICYSVHEGFCWGIFAVCNPLQAIVESLPHNTTLQELDLQNCGASDAGMDILAKALTQCKTLKQVFVWGNEFGPTACAAWRDLALRSSMQGPQEHLVTDVEPVEIDGLPSIVFVND